MRITKLTANTGFTTYSVVPETININDVENIIRLPFSVDTDDKLVFDRVNTWYDRNKKLLKFLLEEINKSRRAYGLSSLSVETDNDIFVLVSGSSTLEEAIDKSTTSKGVFSIIKIDQIQKIKNEKVKNLFMSVYIKHNWEEVSESCNVVYPRILEIRDNTIKLKVSSDKKGLFIGSKGKNIKYIEREVKRKIKLL